MDKSKAHPSILKLYIAITRDSDQQDFNSADRRRAMSCEILRHAFQLLAYIR
jgi:hypothetical protein